MDTNRTLSWQSTQEKPITPWSKSSVAEKLSSWAPTFKQSARNPAIHLLAITLQWRQGKLDHTLRGKLAQRGNRSDKGGSTIFKNKGAQEIRTPIARSPLRPGGGGAGGHFMKLVITDNLSFTDYYHGNNQWQCFIANQNQECHLYTCDDKFRESEWQL